MSKLKIGVTANKLYLREDELPSIYKAYCSQEYIDALSAAGAIPVMLPVLSHLEDIPDQIAGLDAVLFSGGYDIDPSLYGEEPIPEIKYYIRDIDEYNIAVVKAAQEARIPMLGICKGLQVLNVALGGSLYQDLYSQHEGSHKHVQTTQRFRPSHTVDLAKGSFVEQAFGEKYRVNSFHHQSIKDVAEKLEVTGRATDGIVEACESISSDNFIVGVQWHPEMMAAAGDQEAIGFFKQFLAQSKDWKDTYGK